MKTRIIISGLLALSMLTASCGQQQDQEAAETHISDLPSKGIEIAGAWARPGNVDGNTAVYMEIRNGSAQADTITGLNSDVAAMTELHETYETEDGMMGMRPARDLSLPAEGVRELRPGGLHIMIMGLNRDLRAGDSFELVLDFEIAGTDTVMVPVGIPGES